MERDPSRASTPTKNRAKRTRLEFTQAEDRKLTEFLAGLSSSSRGSISTFREIARRSWGSRHNPESWQAHYNRRRSHYEAQIKNFVDRSSEELDSSENEDERSLKRRKLTLDRAPIADDVFRDHLCIPYQKFAQNPGPLSDTDQYVGINLAIELLSAKHGFAPEVVYSTWQLTKNLSLADELLRRTGIFLESEGEVDSDGEEIAAMLTPKDRRGSRFPDDAVSLKSNGKSSPSAVPKQEGNPPSSQSRDVMGRVESREESKESESESSSTPPPRRTLHLGSSISPTKFYNTFSSCEELISESEAESMASSCDAKHLTI